jgi:nicotinamide-nucleotide amidase
MPIAVRDRANYQTFMTNRTQQLIDEILQHAASAGLTITTAESCTAGRLAVEFAKGEGAARHFVGGFVTYTKDAKASLLGVPKEMLLKETAVSPNVAATMARGAIAKSGASLGVAITGVTGSKPDEDGNPIGLVYCAVARSGGGVKTLRLELGMSAPAVLVEQTIDAALTLLRDFVFA